MAFGREVKRRLKAVIAPVFFLALALYFGWSATRGPHGLVASRAREVLLAKAQTDLAALEASKEAWQRKVAALSKGRMDTDLLDERAREMLNLSDPNDILVPYPEGKRLY